MGYRSDVGLVLSKEGITVLKNKRDLLAPDSNKRKAIDELFSYADQHHNDHNSEAQLWFWSAIKWYTLWDDYMGIVFVEKVMEELPEDDYLFIRIGEDFDDCEVKGDFWENPFNMGLHRSVTFRS